MTEETDKTGKKCCRGWKFVLIPFCIAAAVLIFGTLVMYLWNAFMPDIFSGLKPITFWQAVGLTVLAKILFGSFSRGCGRRCRGGRHSYYWSQKWKNMSEEERAKMKEEWANKRCGGSEC